MAQIKVKAKETEAYALNQPDILRVSIRGGIVVDRRDDVYWTFEPGVINERARRCLPSAP